MGNKYEDPGNTQNKEERVGNGGYVTTEKGDVQTKEEWNEELKRRKEDPNWYRES
jgi:hypothetical protein